PIARHAVVALDVVAAGPSVEALSIWIENDPRLTVRSARGHRLAADPHQLPVRLDEIRPRRLLETDLAGRGVEEALDHEPLLVASAFRGRRGLDPAVEGDHEVGAGLHLLLPRIGFLERATIGFAGDRPLKTRDAVAEA